MSDVEGDSTRRPPTKVWYDKYAWLVHGAVDAGGILNVPRLRADLAAACPVNVRIRALTSGVPGSVIQGRLDFSPSLGRSIEYRVTAVPHLPKGERLSAEWRGY